MRTILLCLFIILCSSQVNAQVQSTPFAQPDFAAAYDGDIKNMAVAQMYRAHSPDTAFIDIPASALVPVRSALAALFNTGSALKADSIFSNYCLHTDSLFIIGENQKLAITIDTTFAWTNTWMSYQTTTGIAVLDQTLAHFGFSVESIHYYPPNRTNIRLRTHQMLNLGALGDSIMAMGIPGIIDAGEYGWGIAGSPPDWFVYNRDLSGNHYFNIIAAGGFVPAQLWEYNVSSTWFVDSITIYGNSSNYGNGPLPNCGLHPLSIHTAPTRPTFSISPNPATTSISFQIYDFAAQYRIIDMQGRVLAHGNVIAPVNVVDISSLPSATYNLQLTTIQGATVSKLFTKQ